MSYSISYTETAAKGFRFHISHEGVEVARARLYILHNDLHEGRPFGLLEDVFVEAAHRSNRIGNTLLDAVLARATEERCYKLIATSRNDGSRDTVHEWYLRRGFREYGTEFRLDFQAV